METCDEGKMFSCLWDMLRDQVTVTKKWKMAKSCTARHLHRQRGSHNLHVNQVLICKRKVRVCVRCVYASDQ